MPDHLEYVVRPSQAPQIRPGVPTQIFATPKIVDNPPIVWGNAGPSIFDLNASLQVELPEPLKEETERKFDVVRVFSEDDRDVYVDTEQMTEYKGRNRISNDRITLRFAQPQNTQFTEVRQRNVIRRQPGAS